jgi:hypothetical protein
MSADSTLHTHLRDNLIRYLYLVNMAHILCDCEAIADLRCRHLGQFFMEPSDFYDAPISRVLHFIKSVGLIKD